MLKQIQLPVEKRSWTRSFTTAKFWNCYAKLPKNKLLENTLPENTKLEAKKAYRLWQNNPQHPSLHFKKANNRSLWAAVHITLDYRALAIKN